MRTELDVWIENSKARENGNVGLNTAPSLPSARCSCSAPRDHAPVGLPPRGSKNSHTVFSVRSESEMNASLESRSSSEDETLSHSQGNLEAFDVLLSRYRPVLSLIAYRVLGNHEEAEDAVQNCLRAASDSAPRFEHEGAFRSWLARVLIDEAVTILNRQRTSTWRS